MSLLSNFLFILSKTLLWETSHKPFVPKCPEKALPQSCSLPSKPINSLYYTGRLCRENVLMLRDFHNVCATAPKNGIFLLPDMTE